MISKSNLIKLKLQHHLTDYISIVDEVGVKKFFKDIFIKEFSKKIEKEDETKSGLKDNTYWKKCFDDLSYKEQMLVKTGYIVKYNKYLLKDILNKNIDASEEYKQFIIPFLNGTSSNYSDFVTFFSYYKNFGRIIPIDDLICEKVLKPICNKIKINIGLIEDENKYKEVEMNILKFFTIVEALYYNGKINEVLKVIDLNIIKQIYDISKNVKLLNQNKINLIDFIINQLNEINNNSNDKENLIMCKMNYFSNFILKNENNNNNNSFINNINKTRFFKIERIVSVLKEMNIDYLTEYNFDNYKVDFYLPKYNAVIELNGFSHYYPLQTQLKEKDKFRYCYLRRMYGLKFLFIQKFYDEYYTVNEQYNEYIRKSLGLILNDNQLDKNTRLDIKYDIIEEHNKPYFEENYFFQHIKYKY